MTDCDGLITNLRNANNAAMIAMVREIVRRAQHNEAAARAEAEAQPRIARDYARGVVDGSLDTVALIAAILTETPEAAA